MDKTAKTIASYNQCAEAFAALHMDLGIYQKFMAQFSRQLQPGAQILDLACGPGNVAKFLLGQNKGYRLTGVDLSSAMLHLSRQNAPEAEFQLADLRTLDVAQSFDAVILSFCIFHLEDREAWLLLQKTFRWLKPGGYLYVNFMEGGQPGFETPSFAADYEIFFNYYSTDTFVPNLQSLGFTVVASQSQDYTRSSGQVIKEVFIFAQKPPG